MQDDFTLVADADYPRLARYWMMISNKSSGRIVQTIGTSVSLQAIHISIIALSNRVVLNSKLFSLVYAMY